MRLLLDEHYSQQIARQMRDAGHDVIAVAERADLIGTADRDLLRRCACEGRALLTNNVEDFVILARELAAAGESHAGLVFTSDRSLPRSRAGIGGLVRALSALMQSEPGEHALADQIRWLTPVG
jgi:hypothetical protein